MTAGRKALWVASALLWLALIVLYGALTWRIEREVWTAAVLAAMVAAYAIAYRADFKKNPDKRALRIADYLTLATGLVLVLVASVMTYRFWYLRLDSEDPSPINREWRASMVRACRQESRVPADRQSDLLTIASLEPGQNAMDFVPQGFRPELALEIPEWTFFSNASAVRTAYLYGVFERTEGLRSRSGEPLEVRVRQRMKSAIVVVFERVSPPAGNRVVLPSRLQRPAEIGREYKPNDDVRCSVVKDGKLAPLYYLTQER